MYRKSLRRMMYERKVKRCAAMRAAKARKRATFMPVEPAWKRVRTMLIGVWAHEDGRHVAICLNGRWERMGSERAVRGWLARKLYGEEGAKP